MFNFKSVFVQVEIKSKSSALVHVMALFVVYLVHCF